jgi:hypothetical protein
MRMNVGLQPPFTRPAMTGTEAALALMGTCLPGPAA